MHWTHFLSQPVNNEQRRGSRQGKKHHLKSVKIAEPKEIQRGKTKQEIKSLDSKHQLRHKDCGDKGKICTEWGSYLPGTEGQWKQAAFPFPPDSIKVGLLSWRRAGEPCGRYFTVSFPMKAFSGLSVCKWVCVNMCVSVYVRTCACELILL